MKAETQQEFRQTWRGALSDYVTAIAWSPDSRYLAAASAAGEVALFSVRTWKAMSLQGDIGHIH